MPESTMTCTSRANTKLPFVVEALIHQHISTDYYILEIDPLTLELLDGTITGFRLTADPDHY